MQSNLAKKYTARISSVFEGDHDWIYSKAQPVDLNSKSERKLVRDLSEIMKEAISVNQFNAISSNNIAWNATNIPLQVIRVPKAKGTEYVTLVNPKITKLGDKIGLSIEACGSLHGLFFQMPRARHAHVEGTLLRGNTFENVQLEYDEFVYELQHECDHLNGITLPMRNPAYYFFGGATEDNSIVGELILSEMVAAMKSNKIQYCEAKPINGNYGGYMCDATETYSQLPLELSLDVTGKKWMLHEYGCAKQDPLQKTKLALPNTKEMKNLLTLIQSDEKLQQRNGCLSIGINWCECVTKYRNNESI